MAIPAESISFKQPFSMGMSCCKADYNAYRAGISGLVTSLSTNHPVIVWANHLHMGNYRAEKNLNLEVPVDSLNSC